MKNLPLNPKIFIENRKRFVKEMKPISIAIFNSNDEVPSNGDALYRFQQNTSLYWLCGIEQEDTMVILFPDNPEEKYREVFRLTFHQPLYLIRLNWNIPHQVNAAGFCDPDIVFNTNTHLLLFDIDSGFNCKHHAFP